MKGQAAALVEPRSRLGYGEPDKGRTGGRTARISIDHVSTIGGHTDDIGGGSIKVESGMGVGGKTPGAFHIGVTGLDHDIDAGGFGPVPIRREYPLDGDGALTRSAGIERRSRRGDNLVFRAGATPGANEEAAARITINIPFGPGEIGRFGGHDNIIVAVVQCELNAAEVLVAVIIGKSTPDFIFITGLHNFRNAHNGLDAGGGGGVGPIAVDRPRCSQNIVSDSVQAFTVIAEVVGVPGTIGVPGPGGIEPLHGPVVITGAAGEPAAAAINGIHGVSVGVFQLQPCPVVVEHWAESTGLVGPDVIDRCIIGPLDEVITGGLNRSEEFDDFVASGISPVDFAAT